MSSTLGITTPSNASRSESEGERETSTKRTNPRSCYDCHSRKIRCDKKEPCTPCRRSGKVCTYPPLGPRIRRTRKAIMADVATRVSRLEKSLAQAQRQQARPEITGLNRKPSPSKSALPSNFKSRSREDILVQNGSSSQYFNEVFLSRVIEEVSGERFACATSILTGPGTQC